MKVESKIERQDTISGYTYIYIVHVVDDGQYESKELVISALTSDIGHLDHTTATFNDYREAVLTMVPYHR